MRNTILLSLFLPLISYGFELSNETDPRVQECYAKAMVGLDSVINARLGVPPENALYLTNIEEYTGGDPVYDRDMLIIMLDAYLWEQSPHNYAVNVFYHCAVNPSILEKANLDSDP